MQRPLSSLAADPGSTASAATGADVLFFSLLDAEQSISACMTRTSLHTLTRPSHPGS